MADALRLAGEEAVRSENPRHFVVRTAWLYWESGRNFLRSMYTAAAKRPAYSVLTSIREPRIELPAWQEGVAEFARGC